MGLLAGNKKVRAGFSLGMKQRLGPGAWLAALIAAVRSRASTGLNLEETRAMGNPHQKNETPIVYGQLCRSV